MMVPRNSHVSDILESLQKRLNLSDEIMKNVQLYEAHQYKFYKSLSPNDQIAGTEYMTVYAGMFPDDDESAKKIPVFHFDKEPIKSHGVPFQFPLKEVCLTITCSVRALNNAIGRGVQRH